MEIRQLEILCAIAEERHFGRAAQRLFLGAATVTQLLQRLESELGVRLVHRTSRKVELTAAGLALQKDATQILAELDRAVRNVRRAAPGADRPLRIATNYPAGRLLLLPLLERLRRRSPQPELLLRELGTPEQLALIQRGELDIGMVYGPVADHPGLRSERLIDVTVMATVRAGHVFAERRSISYPELVGFRCLAGHRNGSTRIAEAVQRAAAHRGVSLDVDCGATDLASHLLEIEAGDAIGFTSEPRARQSVASGLRLLELTPEPPSLSICVVRSTSEDEPMVAAVIDDLRRIATGRRAAHPDQIDLTNGRSRITG